MTQKPIILDRYLVFTILILFAFGLVMVCSSSIAVSEKMTGGAFFFFKKQAIFGIVSIIAAGVMVFIPTERWQRFGWRWLALGVALLILVLIPGIGDVVNGSRRWIHIGPIAIQVSELIKLCGAAYVAHYFSTHGQESREKLIEVIKPIGMLGFMAVLLLMEPDFGATVVLFMTALGIMFMAGVRIRWFILLISLAVFAMALLVVFSPYRLARLTGFLHPWINQYGSGYQLTQSLIAVGHGGFFGVGLGNSLEKLFYLPEAQNDFILAIIAEELGVVGVLCLVALFAILIWRGLSIAKTAHLRNALFDAYLTYGISFWMGLQVMVNIGVAIGLLPTKGLTLPFISYGGSSLLVDFMVMGIVLRVDYQNKITS